MFLPLSCLLAKNFGPSFFFHTVFSHCEGTRVLWPVGTRGMLVHCLCHGCRMFQGSALSFTGDEHVGEESSGLIVSSWVQAKSFLQIMLMLDPKRVWLEVVSPRSSLLLAFLSN